MQEMIDVYDRDRNHTGLTIPREGAFLKEGQYMLYVLALIENQDGRLLVTQRSLEKHWGAGWWEIPGGGVRSGEFAATDLPDNGKWSVDYTANTAVLSHKKNGILLIVY